MYVLPGACPDGFLPDKNLESWETNSVLQMIYSMLCPTKLLPNVMSTLIARSRSKVFDEQVCLFPVDR